MCHIFAGQDPANYAFETRSVRLMGRATSVRLEAKFWAVLDELSAVQGLATSKFLSLLYEEALETHGQISNFASLLRCCCLNFLGRDFDHDALKAQVAEAVSPAAT